MNPQQIFRSAWARYVVAVILVALAAALRIWPLQASESRLPWLTFYPAVTVVAIYGGFSAGFLATVLACLTVTFLWPILVAQPFINNPADWVGMAIFFLTCILISGVAEAMRRSQARGIKIQEQTVAANNKLKQGETDLMHYAAIIESSDDAIVGSNLEGIITSWNSGAERLFGYSREEMQGHPTSLLIPEQCQNEEMTLMEQIRSGVFVKHYETVRRCKDGKLIDISLTLSPLRDQKGDIVGASKIARDITKRKKMMDELVDSEKEFRLLAESMPQVVWITRADGWNIFFNNHWVEYTGLTLEESYGHGWNKPFHPDDQQRAWDAWQNAVFNKGKYSLECKLRRADGVYLWWLVRGVPVIDENGKILKWFGTCTDINDIKVAEIDLRIAATAFETQEGMAVTDADGTILRVNRAYTNITGYTAEEVIGKNPRIFKSGRHDANFYVAMWESINNTGAWEGEVWNRRKNGEAYPERLSITAVKNADGITTNYVATFDDITLSLAAENEIKQLAFYDPLTRLPNRRLLKDRLGQTMAANKRSGRYSALMFLDLDNFKPINDTYGHGVGDLLLAEVAVRISSCVREMDTVARFGGDEFVVMLTQLDEDKAESTAQASTVAEKIRVTLAEPYLLTIHQDGKAECTVEHHCTSSIGVVLFINHEASTDDILKWADIAMYKAKEDGRNLIRFYDSKF